ncbi:MAG: hypothetical protein R3B95_18350 [Nitrospirales bacterium]|nr:hypothetical protein [Nitrospirales bacterium]
MAKRRIHFGIDFGTSTSKIVVRDYGAAGGERATVVLNKRGSYEFPSNVKLVDDLLVFGASPFSNPPVTTYTSVKMRVAAEVKGQDTSWCYGSQPTLPDGISAADLAVLTVWWLISEARRALDPDREYALGMTLGIPMSFFNDTQLRASFLRISRAAWFLFRQYGLLKPRSQIRLDRARQRVKEAYDHIDSKEVPADQVRDWIRSEAEAAMWWAYNAPEVPAGPYGKIDIGAGTTNASVFRIVNVLRGGRQVKGKLAFFGSTSVSFGMDAVDEALANWQGLDSSKAVMCRRKEEKLLKDFEASLTCENAIREIVRGFHKAWWEGYRKNQGSPDEVQTWDATCQLFVIGGGSQVGPIREKLIPHPDPNKRNRKFVLHQLSNPQDLWLRPRERPSSAMLPFVLVAYGLSVIGLSIPEAKIPSEVPSIPKSEARVKFLDADDIYSK